MNDIIERIRDTEEVVTSFVRPEWASLLSVLVPIALTFAGFAVTGCAFHRYNEWHVENPGHDTKLGIALPNTLLYLSTLVGITVAAFADKPSLWVFVVLLAVSVVGILWLVVRRIHVGYGSKGPAPKREVARTTVAATAVSASMMTAGIVVAFVLSVAVPLAPVNAQQPTAKATATAAEALDDIAESVMAAYDVEVLPEYSCSRPRRPYRPTWIFDSFDTEEDLLRADILATNDTAWENEKVALFLEAASGDNPDEAPQMRLATGAGVIGCYRLLYDGETARLYVDAEQTDLPAPAAFKKDES